MNFKDHITVLQGARKTSLAEFADNYDISKLLEAPNDYLVDGAPLVKCLPGSTASNHLVDKGAFAQPLDQLIKSAMSPRNTRNFMDMLTDSIININKAGNYKECIKIMQGIQLKIGNSFYGALFIDGKTILNPFHPLTAMLMADEKKYKKLHSATYRIAIYAYPDEEQYKNYHRHYHSDLADASFITENLNSLIQVAAHQIETKIRMVGSEPTQSENVKLKYQISKHPDEEPNYEFYLSAHQMLTSGIVLPWYGTSFIKMNGSTSGCHISPMRSCNISGGSVPSNATSTRDWSNVCTGSLSNSSLTGLRSLNHANLLSPYNSNIMAPGALVYAQMAVNKSFQIYRSAGFITGNIYEETYLTPDKSGSSQPNTPESESNDSD